MASEPRASPPADDAAGELQLAFAHDLAGRQAEAESSCKRILEREPGHAGALQLMGLMAQQQGRLNAALRLMRMAVAAEPGVADYRNSLGTVLADLKRLDEALAEFDRATGLRPGYAQAYRNRGIALARAGRLAEAAAPLKEAARLRPEDVRAWEDLVSLHHQLGDLPAMIECRRRIAALRPDDPAALGELLVLLHYSPDVSPEQLLEEHHEWARRFEGYAHAGRLDKQGRVISLPSPGAPGAGNSQTSSGSVGREGKADRRGPLRVGYVSGDFREHPAAWFVLPIVQLLLLVWQ
jgi:tetratricopeptide (TPR) repeat protein